jgi:tetratricopeptide (TPR) repeat protein
MLRVALMPPHPAHAKSTPNAKPHCTRFQCIFTNRFTIIRVMLLATPISSGVWRVWGEGLAFLARFLTFALIGLLAVASSWGGTGATNQTDSGIASRAKKAFEAARARFQADTNNAEAQWQFGRAAFDWAEYASNNAQRIEVAQQGIAACRLLIVHDPKSAPAHYYVAMNLGRVADAKRGLDGLKLVGQMESEFTLVLGLDPALDYAGAERNLGMLYRDAPGWPISIGSKMKAREKLEAALKRAPGSPENHLNLIEAQLTWGEKSAALKGLKVLDELWPEAQKKLSGDEWEASWLDWEKRRDQAGKAAGAPSRTVQSPRK